MRMGKPQPLPEKSTLTRYRYISISETFAWIREKRHFRGIIQGATPNSVQ